MPSGDVIAAIAIDDFLVTAQNNRAMDEFYNVMKTRYNIKRLGRPRRYLGWHCHYKKDGSIALSQRLLIDQTLQHANMINANGKSTPFPSDMEYHAPNKEDTYVPETLYKCRQLVGDLRYIADSTRPDIGFVVGRLGTAMGQPTIRHWKIMNATLRYLKKTRNFGLIFRKKKRQGKSTVETSNKTRPIQSCANADWANDRMVRR